MKVTDDDHSIRGHCPMGCGKTLFRGQGGYVTCSWAECPNPGAASDILAESETQHIVIFGEDDWTMQHPLRERLNGELFDCPVHRHVSELSGPPVQLGRYRVWPAENSTDEHYYWEPLR